MIPTYIKRNAKTSIKLIAQVDIVFDDRILYHQSFKMLFTYWSFMYPINKRRIHTIIFYIAIVV